MLQTPAKDEAEEALSSLKASKALVSAGSPEELAVQIMEMALKQSTPMTGRLSVAMNEGNRAVYEAWQMIESHPVMAKRVQ